MALLFHLFSCFDPLLGFARGDDPPLMNGVTPLDPSEVRRIPGFDVWPANARMNEVDLTVMTVGGSTSDRWCGGSWPMHLARILNDEAGIRTVVFNGGCASYHSGQELLKIQRDAPVLRPDLILSLSGVNDLEDRHTQNRAPFLHFYQGMLADSLVKKSEVFDSYTLGLPNKAPAHENWLRHVSFARAAARVLGAEYLSFLQPSMGAGPFTPSAREQAVWDEQVSEQYVDSITAYYGAIRERLAEFDFVTDISNVFEGQSDVYIEYRHPGDKGNQLMARRMYEVLCERGALDRWMKGQGA